MQSKKKPNKLVLAIGLAIHATAVTLTWRDLRARPADRVRGNKKAWRLASALNTMGSAGYWLFGRR